MSRQLVKATIERVDSLYLHVKSDAGQHYSLAWHGQVDPRTPRAIGARVELHWLGTASGGWWKAMPEGRK